MKEMPIRSQATLRIEFNLGCDVVDAIEEAKHKARALDFAIVEFSFNGVVLRVNRYSDVDVLVDAYRDALRNGKQFASAWVAGLH